MRKVLQTELFSLSESLERFDPSLKGKFVCPQCFDLFDVMEELTKHPNDCQISVEHIKPESAGGKICTFLCTRCNSGNGSTDTKWLAKYSQMIRGDFDFLDSGERKGKSKGKGKRKSKRKKRRAAGGLTPTLSAMVADGQAVKGAVTVAEDGAIEVLQLVPRGREPRAEAHDSTKDRTLTLHYRPYLVGHEAEIVRAMLIAAHLLWFHAFGYSWSFCTQAVRLRSSIFNGDGRATEATAVFDRFDEETESYWICILECGGHAFPAAVIEDKLVVLPSRHAAITELTGEHEPKVFRIVCPPIGMNREFSEFKSPVAILFEREEIMIPCQVSEAQFEMLALNLLRDGSVQVLQQLKE